MGWTSGFITRNEVKEYAINDLYHGAKTLAHSWSGNSLWVVRERSDGNRFIALFMVERWGKENWAYKDVDESMGPCYYTCPKKYLDMVPYDPPFHGVYSEAWRDRVVEYWFNQKKKQS